jgi:hypothetical protein
MQTDTTDSDSDEPIKKLATNTNSISSTSSNASSTKVSTTAEAGSSSDGAVISDEFSNGASKGRDYDLTQVISLHYSSASLFNKLCLLFYLDPFRIEGFQGDQDITSRLARVRFRDNRCC